MQFDFQNTLSEEQKLASQSIPDFCAGSIEMHGQIANACQAIAEIGKENGIEKSVLCPHGKFIYYFFCYKVVKDNQHKIICELQRYVEVAT